MCPGKDLVTAENILIGVKGTEQKEYNVGCCQSEMQVFLFYPCDWEEDSFSLLSSFSSLYEQFSSRKCSVFGCSTDSVSSHLNWIKTEFGTNLPFPLLADKVGHLADRFQLYDREEQVNLRGVVIADSKGNEIEIIETSLDSKELGDYTLNVVKQAGKPSQSIENKGRVDIRKMDTNVEMKARVPAPTPRSLDHIWSQVVDQGKGNTVVESKRPQPNKLWTNSSTVHSNNTNAGTGQKAAPTKVWTPPSSQPVEPVQPEVSKPATKSHKTWGAPSAPLCPGCGKAVYPVDQVFSADRRHFHKSCIDCGIRGCSTKLTVRTIHKVGAVNMCSKCFSQQDKGTQVSTILSKVETAQEVKQREDKEMQEKKAREEAMMELKAAIGGGGVKIKSL